MFLVDCHRLCMKYVYLLRLNPGCSCVTPRVDYWRLEGISFLPLSFFNRNFYLSSLRYLIVLHTAWLHSALNYYYLAVLRIRIRKFLNGLVAGCDSFCLFFKFYNIHRYVHSITFIQYIYPSAFAGPLSISSSLVSSVEKPLCGAEPRIELWPTLQQADALQIDPRRIRYDLYGSWFGSFHHKA